MIQPGPVHSDISHVNFESLVYRAFPYKGAFGYDIPFLRLPMVLAENAFLVNKGVYALAKAEFLLAFCLCKDFVSWSVGLPELSAKSRMRH